jgi:predicted O-linked N-acetylglucosamine transferase (SPINDLY family)
VLLSRAAARFERLGLPLDRVIFEARKPENQYVLYNRVDIALDPFPYNGGTTSLDSLWMGVPYIALEGSHIVSRMGSAILTTVGLPELVARTRDEYVDVATRLALDANWLRAMRHDLRGRMQRSPAMDHQLLADNMGSAFRSMWQIWVDQSAAPSAA